MAKANIGNLLQHFLALHGTSHLLDHLGEPDPQITYIDPFAMDAWEANARSPANAAFRQVLDTFASKAESGDLVARTFLAAWNEQYGTNPVPSNPIGRLYPNTSVLLATAFPSVRWTMWLHEMDPAKQESLRTWFAGRDAIACQVEDNWRNSPLLNQAVLPADRPILLMLDPYQVTEEGATKSKEPGYLPENQLRKLVGKFGLDLFRADRRATPTMVLAFSYADSKPDRVDRVIRRCFPDWRIDRVRTGPLRIFTNDAWHQGWCIRSPAFPETLTIPQATGNESLQQRWESWSAVD